MAENNNFQLIDNYIWISTLNNGEGEFLVIPTYPDQLDDRMTSSFQQTNALSRSAPVFSYSNSGPRSMQISLSLHRDVMQMLNYNVSNMRIENIGDDYVDTLIKKLMSVAVPRYNAADKSVQVPHVAVRFGNEVFIKGVVSGDISVTYQKPLLDNNKYAQVAIAFMVYETDPYDADTIAKEGSFRGMTRPFKQGLYKGDEE